MMEEKKDKDGYLENTLPLPQRVKASSVSGLALLSILERNRAHSAFKRFSQLPILIFVNSLQNRPFFILFKELEILHKKIKQDLLFGDKNWH